VAASTLSRIETGKAPTKTAYLTALLELYEVTDAGQRQVLADMAREGHRKGWWAVYDDVPTGFGIYVGLEAEAAGLRTYETQVVNGLLQTPEYARAVERELHNKDSPEQLQRLAKLRLNRPVPRAGRPGRRVRRFLGRRHLPGERAGRPGLLGGIRPASRGGYVAGRFSRPGHDRGQGAHRRTEYRLTEGKQRGK
jgi:hypothetical protein